MSSKQILSLNSVLNILLVRQRTWYMKVNVVLHSKVFNRTRMISVLMKISLIKILCSTTVEPPITDPPTSGQPLYNGHWLWHQLKLLQN